MFTKTQPGARWTLIAGLILGLAGSAVAPQAAHADQTVRTNTEANLRARPGERAPTLAHLDEGQSVRVLGRQGRWLKVSVKGKVGWITRTQIADEGESMSARASSEKKRTAAAKARKKGWSSMDDEAVGSDAVDGADADEGEEASAADEESAPVEKTAKESKKEAKEEREAAKEERAAKEEEASASDEEDAPSKSSKSKKEAMKAPAKKAKIAKGGEVVTVRSTAVHAKPSKKSDEKWDADKGTKLTVVAMNEEGDWIKVEDSDGEKGWVAKKDLRASAADGMDSDDSGDAVASSDDSVDEGRSVRAMAAKQGPMAIWASANVGVLAKIQTYASGGTGLRANYGLDNTAPAVIGGLGFMRHMGSFNLGAEGGIVATVGGSGIAIAAGAGAPAETLAWTALEIDVRGHAQYVLSPKGYAIGARAGYHVSSVTVDVSDNAKLPSEKLAGFMIGGGFEAPHLTDRIGMRIGADLLVGGTLLQTEGLKDGQESTVSAMFANAGLSYAFTSKLGMTATYQLAYENFAFTGANERESTATNAKRQDLQHVFGVGMAYSF
jgi:uncharacterized protein YgiM (DUF1202 family)